VLALSKRRYSLSQPIERNCRKATRTVALIEKISSLALWHLNLGSIYHYENNKRPDINMDVIITALNEAIEEQMSKEKCVIRLKTHHG
jgi:hypothetical protein